MHLTNMVVENFRSISHLELSSLGHFNVLIGKNNAGKSNLLIALKAFFSCIEDGNVVATHPNVGREIDFYDHNTSQPIEIKATFRLTNAEREELMEDIAEETPQMRNAAQELVSPLSALVTVRIQSSPNQFAYVHSVRLRSSKAGTPGDKILLEIDSTPARELADKLRNYEQRTQDIRTLIELTRGQNSMLQDVFRRREPRSRANIPSSFILRELYGKASPDTRRTVEALLEESSSFDDFRSELLSVTEGLKEDVRKLQEEALTNRIRTFSGEESFVPGYARHFLQSIAQNRVLHLAERRKQIGKQEASRLLKLKIRRGGLDTLSTIQETVSTLLGVAIDAFEGTSGESVAELDVDNFLVEANGSGIREALRLILDFEFQQPDILLVEEPEIHLHPALEISMMRYLRRISHKCQVFLTTHSTNFLDTAEMDNVYLVSKNGSTHIRHLDLEDAEELIPEELGIRLSSLFMFDRLAFTEGPTDEAVFRELASKLGVNLSQANVGFISMGGARNFTHYAVEKVLTFLTRRRVEMWFVIDRDEKSTDEIERLRNYVDDTACFHVLEKRELENYLLVPRALVEFVQLKRQMAGEEVEAPSIQEMRTALEESAEQLKQLLVNKRVEHLVCRPVYPSVNDEEAGQLIVPALTEEFERIIHDLDDIKSQIEPILKEQTEVVSKTWENNKLNLVPGDLLLDTTCKRFGVRFKKERDSVRLASLLREEEIDTEIGQLIREIGTPT